MGKTAIVMEEPIHITIGPQKLGGASHALGKGSFDISLFSRQMNFCCSGSSQGKGWKLSDKVGGAAGPAF